MTPLEEIEEMLSSKYPDATFGGYNNPYIKQLSNGSYLAKYTLFQRTDNGKTHHILLSRVMHEDSGIAVERALSGLLKQIKARDLTRKLK